MIRAVSMSPRALRRRARRLRQKENRVVKNVDKRQLRLPLHSTPAEIKEGVNSLVSAKDFVSRIAATDGRTYFQCFEHRQYPRLSVRIHGLVGELPVRTIHIEDYEVAIPIESLEEALDICRQGLKFRYYNTRRRTK